MVWCKSHPSRTVSSTITGSYSTRYNFSPGTCTVILTPATWLLSNVIIRTTVHRPDQIDIKTFLYIDIF
jgi:hypothetical protein